ncbi:hypothetical protein [Halodesulfovibrio sp.]|nr:hypothetical protein [Halodesulfovibrio sp.]
MKVRKDSYVGGTVLSSENSHFYTAYACRFAIIIIDTKELSLE